VSLIHPWIGCRHDSGGKGGCMYQVWLATGGDLLESLALQTGQDERRHLV
jgi:hypothetical protein